MNCAYLGSRLTLPNSIHRRADAFEHDQMMSCLRPAFAAKGSLVSDVAWDDTQVEWSRFDAVIIGTTWDYQDRHSEFLDALARIGAQARLFNSLPLVKWNSDKSYLRDLEQRSVHIVPTVWCEFLDQDSLDAAFDQLQCDEIVIKRQIGANADGQHKLRIGSVCPKITVPVMVQAYLAAIQTDGELSFVFIGGEFSHAVRKVPAEGDYRIQAVYGGRETILVPAPEDLELAASILDSLPERPLYARVDLVRDDQGQLCLIELELVEPYLYPPQGPRLGPLLHSALETAVST